MPPSSRSQPTRFVVIPSFDQPDDTTRCVDALQGKSLGEYTVVVVDHGQQGWTVPDDLSSDAVQVIRADPDLWWTGATNVGIQHAIDQGATSVMLMNADCVLDSASATRLFQRCEAEGTIVAPIQVDLANGATACAGAIPLTLLGFPTIR